MAKKHISFIFSLIMRFLREILFLQGPIQNFVSKRLKMLSRKKSILKGGSGAYSHPPPSQGAEPCPRMVRMLAFAIRDIAHLEIVIFFNNSKWIGILVN